MPSMLAQALRDPEYWKSVKQGLTDTVNRGFVGSLLGAPVDIANMAMGSLGVPVSQKPVMGSEWIGQKMQDVGVVSPNRNPVAETLASFVDPATVGTGAAKLGLLGMPALLGMTKSAGKAQDALKVADKAVDGGKAMSLPYQIEHKPMTVEGGASPLHELTSSFGEDIYGKNALQYFGSGDVREKNVLRILNQVRNNPNAEVTIYRGAPMEASKINPGDWVTLDKSTAQDYVDLALENEGKTGKVYEMKVKAKDITSWPDSLLEFGYHPSN